MKRYFHAFNEITLPSGQCIPKKTCAEIREGIVYFRLVNQDPGEDFEAPLSEFSKEDYSEILSERELPPSCSLAPVLWGIDNDKHEEYLLGEILKESPPHWTDVYLQTREISCLMGDGQKIVSNPLTWLPEDPFCLLSKEEPPKTLSVLPMKRAIASRVLSDQLNVDVVLRPTKPETNLRLVPEATYQGWAYSYQRLDSMDQTLSLLLEPLSSDFSPIPVWEHEGDLLSVSVQKQARDRREEEIDHAEKVLSSLVEGSYLDLEWGPKLRKFLREG